MRQQNIWHASIIGLVFL